MENITMRFVYDKNKKATQEKPAPLMVEVRQNKTNKSVYINTGIKLFPDQFNKKNGFTCKNHPRASMVTVKAKGIFNKVEAFAYSEKCTSLDEVRNYEGNKTYDENVIDFITKELRESNPTSSVLEHHSILINKLKEFGEIETFEDLTYASVDRFDKFLRKTINSQPVLYKRHNAFKRYVVKAVKLGLCKSNPYDEFQYKKGKDLKVPVFLLDDELERIKNYVPTNDKLEKVRDLFVFQCYTGMAYTDLTSFTKDLIHEQDGYKVIRGYRNKTGVEFFSLLLPEAEEILNKYEVLPRISNQKYNDYLKLIQVACGINKTLTSHVARHTYATYLLNKDVPIETVSRAIGHSNVKQTTLYAKLLGKKVIDDMKKLL